jgi:hypothetical protein
MVTPGGGRPSPRGRAAEQRDELAAFQLIELHSVPPPARARLQDNGLAKISQEGSATTARPITDQIFSALPQGSLLADQQKKHSDSYQHRNQNTDDKRHNPMPIHGRFRSSAFLRRSDAQPEEKFVHSGQRRCFVAVCLRLR